MLPMFPVYGVTYLPGCSAAIKAASEPRDVELYRTPLGMIYPLQKSLTHFRCWNHAGVFPPKPSVAIAGNQVINYIAGRGGNDPKNIQDRPRSSESAHDPKGGGAARVTAAVLDQNNRFHPVRAQSELSEYLCPGL